MTKQYIITLTDAEDKALSAVVYDQTEWINHVIHDRCRIAIDEIVNEVVQQKLAAGEPIIGSKEDIVLAAEIETAAERHARIDAEFKAQLEQQG